MIDAWNRFIDRLIEWSAERQAMRWVRITRKCHREIFGVETMASDADLLTVLVNEPRAPFWTACEIGRRAGLVSIQERRANEMSGIAAAVLRKHTAP